MDRSWAAPLRLTAFRRYYAGQALSQVGDSLIGVALAFGVLAVTRSATALGLVLLSSRLPVIVFTVFGGIAGDRYSRRSVMMACDLLRVLTQAVTAALLLSGQARVWQLAVLQAVAGTAQAFFAPAATGLVAQVVPARDLGSANALLGVTGSIATLLAPVLSGVLIALVGPGLSFAVDAATFAGSAVALWLLPLGPVAVPARRPLLETALLGWSEFRARRWLWVPTVHLTLLNGLGIAPFLVLGPLIAVQRLGGATAWVTVGVGYGAGTLAGNAVAVRWRPRHPLYVAVAGSLLLVPFLALLAVAAPVPVLLAAAVPAGLQAGLYSVLRTTTTQTLVPADLLSTLTAFGSLGGLAIVPLAMAAAGPLADAFGATPLLLTLNATIGVLTLATLAVPEIRHLTTTGPSLAKPSMVTTEKD